MKVFRLSKAKYKEQLSGYGASLNGQRWNSKGTEVIYTAESRALACAEVAVHVPMGILPKDYFMVEIEIPDTVAIQEIPTDQLPIGWNFIPSVPSSRVIGDRFVSENKYAVLKVPSVVVSEDFNYILNPKHQDFKKIKIVKTSPFPFDARLFR
ncbi:RES domain protein [Chloroherpeton thalassium ATCC 35110]|uniref:RES domain protein n=1 Tax=Chloroherpeton thalassium (strain ATCC 35110 / GB-78) TaxID=517418 RepID=B3QYQ4_CHLT3|nr:RES family NAD+ phosphorylase [Chloroherpeton thalassium]ACF15127.1 RES domain protein [Chloroherpeton thalassium ATCC 35110]